MRTSLRPISRNSASARRTRSRPRMARVAANSSTRCSQGLEAGSSPAEDASAIRVGDDRAAERRQVDAGQPAARRGARDRERGARHHARCDHGALPARRPRLPAGRHRGRAAPCPGRGCRRAHQRRAHPAGDRRGARRGHGARCPRAGRRAGRQRAGAGARARPRAADRDQQVGRNPAGAARGDPPPAVAQARLRALSLRSTSSRRATAPAWASWRATWCAATTRPCAPCRRRS